MSDAPQGAGPTYGATRISAVPRLGLWAWTFVGVLVTLTIMAAGGLVGGIVGLILAVPATVIASNALVRLRARGLLTQVAVRAEPVVRQALS